MIQKISEFIASRHKAIYWSVFGIGLALLIFIQYFGVVHYHYPVPPGHDAMMHWQMAQPFYNGTVNLFDYIKSGAYPPGFLLLIAKLAHLFDKDMMDIMLWTTPAILILSSLSVFLLVYFVFNRSAALYSFLLYGLTAKVALQQLNDGGYPNLIAAQIFLPLLILFIYLALTSNNILRRILSSLLTLILLFLIPFTHHLSTLYLLVILISSLPIILIYLAITKRWRWYFSLLIFLGLIIIYICSFKFFMTNELFASARGLMGASITFLSHFPFVHITNANDPESLIGLRSYPQYIGEAVFILGMIGLITLPLMRNFWQDNKTKKFIFVYIPVAIWAIILFVGSRGSFLSNPDRLARDLVLPLSIIAGVFVYYLIELVSKKQPKYSIILIIMLILLCGYPFASRFRKALAYEPMVRITQADMGAITYLQNQPPGKILVEAYSFYFGIYLPDWQIAYLWRTQTYQPPDIHPLDSNVVRDLPLLKQYDYIYIVDQQVGWTPTAIKFNFAKNYLDNSNFAKIGQYSSQTNTVYLFKVIK